MPSLPNGCLLWGFSSFFTWLRNRRIKKYNKQSRGVDVCQSMHTGEVFPKESCRDNIIISGGNSNERMTLCENLFRSAHSLNHPMIVFHAGNGYLENFIASNQFGVVLNDRNRMFDLFSDLEFSEILQLVTDSGAEKYNIKPESRYALQVACELNKTRNRDSYFYWLAKCPYLNLASIITDRVKNGLLSQDLANQLSSLLLAGQNELMKIDTFMKDVQVQTKYISIKDPSVTRPQSILSAIQNNQILCIDIKSSTNTVVLELMVNSLIIAMNRGLEFTVFIDDVKIVNASQFWENCNAKIIATKDLYTLVGSREDIFASMLGLAEKTVVFSHSSNISCEKWSKYLGDYDKIAVAQNRSAGWFQSSQWASHSNQGQTESHIRELKILPEQISRLSQNEAFVFDKTTGIVRQTIIT